MGLIYWLLAALHRPDEPFKITLLYRYGDTDYLPLIYALARGQYSEFVTFEAYGSGLLSFPVVSMLPHALCVAVFGDGGFVVADALVSVARFLLAYCLLNIALGNRTFAAVGALLMVVATYELGIWNFRYPRPFVTNLFQIGTLITGVAVWRHLRLHLARPVIYITHGVVIGLAAQGDMHGATGYLIATATLFMLAVFQDDGIRKPIIMAATQVVVGFGAVVFPLLFQSWLTPNDVSQRWGMFEHSRSWFVIYMSQRTFIMLGGLVLLAGLMKVLGKREYASAMSTRQKSVAIVLLVMVGGSVLALPVFSGFLGKGIQNNQFVDRVHSLASLGCVLFLLMMAVNLFRSRPVTLFTSAIVILAGLAIGLVNDARLAVGKEQQPRVWFDDFMPIATYRADLTGLFRELEKGTYKDVAVIGTFDQQLAMLWMTSEGRNLFIPDTFLSTVSDDEIERRTIHLSQIVGFSTDEFMRKATGTYFQERFLGLAKWQATTNYVAANLGDYTAEQLRRALRTRPGNDFWNVELPIGEQRRLRTRFETSGPVEARLDLIVLVDEASYRYLQGPMEGFKLNYRNQTFRVFLRNSLL